MATTGHCLCHAIQYEYDGEPARTVHCHCESCRRQTASPVATFVIVPKSALRFTRGQPKEFASSPGVHRSFCDTCGSPIYYRAERRPDVIDLYAGTLSDLSVISVQSHVHADEQLPWFEILDDLPRFAGTGRGEEPIRRGPRG